MTEPRRRLSVGFGSAAVARAETGWAAGTVIVCALATAVAATDAAQPIGIRAPFFPLWSGLVCAAAVVLVALFTWRAILADDRRMLVLAAVFAFVLPPVAYNVATLPGLISSATRMNSTLSAVLFLLVGLALAAGLLTFARLSPGPARHAGAVLGLVAILGVTVVVVAAWAVPRAPALPPGTHLSRELRFVIGNLVAIAVDLTAALLLVRRRPAASVDVWVAVFAVVEVLNVAISIGSVRFSAGWYTGRVLFASALVVLTVAQIVDFGRLLVRAARLERDASLAEFSPNVMFVADPSGRLVYVNRRWSELTGQPAVDALGAGWRAHVHPDERDTVDGRARDARDLLLRFRATDGTYRWHLLRRSPMRGDNGADWGYVGAAVDVHEQHVALQRERAFAGELQAALFDPALPAVPGFSLDAVYRPSGEEARLGGDWYDVVALRDGRFAITIGDVVGHGLDAATRMVRLREVLRAAAAVDLDPSPAAILAVANRMLVASADALASAIVAVLDPIARSLVIAVAGHPLPVLVRDGRAQSAVRGGGILLGAAADGVWHDEVVAFADGDRFVLYTDGLIEAQHRPLDGEADVLRALERGESARSIVERALAEGSHDDVALLAITVERGAPARGWTFASDDAASAQAARPSLISYLRARGAAADTCAAAEVVFGELVGNVVRHAPGPIDVSLTWVGDAPVLTVRDRGAGMRWAPMLPVDLFAESGRGMFLVETYARDVSVRPRPGGGTEVVVALAAAAAAPAAVG